MQKIGLIQYNGITGACLRDPQIDPVAALTLKRKIDASNQVRTDMVEYIDSYFLQKYSEVKVKADAKINTESPAWAIDRLSILALKKFIT